MGEKIMKQTLNKAMQANLPLLLLGKSGWGKSALTRHVASTLKLPVVTLCLAQIAPEDLGGIPQPDKGKNTFSYLLPDWFIDEPFLLFLDEINQAPPQVMHAIYSLVDERRLHNKVNPEMRVVAAGNLNEENPHLTDIMQPLLNRFYIPEFVHNPEPALHYLSEKYNLKQLNELPEGKSPRDVEQGIKALQAGLDDVCIKKLGLQLYKKLNHGSDTNVDDLINQVRGGKIRDKVGFV